MWPRFEATSDEPVTAAQVVSRGSDAIKAPAAVAFVVIVVMGLIVATIVRSKVMVEQPPGSWQGLLPALVLFGCLGTGFVVGWVWHAATVRRWWDWAVATGVNLDELIAAACEAGLISSRESWWQERSSTLHARQRQR